MGLLSRLKALLGLDAEPAEPTRRDNVDVTIERTPKQAAEPDAETEAAEKGVEETPPAEPEPEPEAEPEAEPEPETEPEPEAEPESIIEEAESGATDEVETEELEPELESEELEPELESEEPEPEPESEPAAEEAPEERVAVDEIKGIGPSYAERLSKAGIDDATALAAADADELAEKTDISAKRLGRWIERAKNR